MKLTQRNILVWNPSPVTLQDRRRNSDYLQAMNIAIKDCNGISKGFTAIANKHNIPLTSLKK